MGRVHLRHDVLITIILIWFIPPVIARDLPEHYLDISAGFSRGDFGTGQNTDLTRLQFSYAQVGENLDFSVTVPYLFVSDNMGDESGLGDINLHAGMMFGDRDFSKNNFYGSVSVKLPTADKFQGLGTGETDMGGFISYTHNFEELNIIVMGGYIVTGDNSIQSYNDILVYSLGLSTYLRPCYLYGSLDGRQNTLDTGDDPLELSAGFFYPMKTTRFLKVEGFMGLNDGGSDFGISVGLVNWF